MDDACNWTPDEDRMSDGVTTSLANLSLPNEMEALCYQLHRHEQMDQTKIAQQLDVSQATVSRHIRRCQDKIAALVNTGRFDRDEMDRLLRKLTATAAHAA